MNKCKNIKKIGYYGTPILLLFLIIMSAFHKTVWVDETYSLSIINHSYIEMLRLATMDVHPPLYYLLLKFIIDIFKPFINCIYIGKIISTIPYFIIMIIGFTFIKRKYGETVSFLFNICILGMPRMFESAIEIRMYSWSTLFVFCTFIFACNILESDIDNNNHNYIFLTIFATLSSYTHYFACASAIIIYIYIIFRTFSKKEFKKISKIFLSGIFVCILYVPWLFTFLNQVLKVTNNYWIQPLTIHSIINSILFFSQFNDNYIFFNLTGIVIFIVIIGIIGIFLNNKDKTAIFAIIVYGGTIFLGVTLSILIRPIFISRYILPSMACFWLSITIGLCNIFKNIKYKELIIIFISIVCIICNYLYFEKEKTNDYYMINTIETIEKNMNDNTTIIINNSHLQRVFAYFYPNNEIILIGEDIEDKHLTLKVYNQCKLTDCNNLNELKKDKSNILILDTNGKLFKELRNMNYSIEKIVTCNFPSNEFGVDPIQLLKINK